MVSIHELDKIVDKIKILEIEKKKLAGFLREIPELYWNVSKVELGNIKIGGEDGGLTKKSGHLMDFVFLRAIGVIFSYKKSKLVDVAYHPIMNPVPEIIHSKESFSDIEFRIFWSLQRIKKELIVSIETISKYSPNLFLIDGSLLVNPADARSTESTVYSDYLEVNKLFEKLCNTAKQENCLLAGVVEDSRSSVFCKHIADNIIEKLDIKNKQELITILNRTKDTNLLHYLLEKREVTKIINLEGGINYFYLKTVEFDRPIRVEFIGDEAQGKRIAELVYTISSQSKTYGLPTVLIEADQRAKLSENDSDNYVNIIASKLGLQNIFFLRRDSRPF